MMRALFLLALLTCACNLAGAQHRHTEQTRGGDGVTRVLIGELPGCVHVDTVRACCERPATTSRRGGSDETRDRGVLFHFPAATPIGSDRMVTMTYTDSLYKVRPGQRAFLCGFPLRAGCALHLSVNFILSVPFLGQCFP